MTRLAIIATIETPLAPQCKFFRAFADEFGPGERAGVDADLVGPGAEHGEHVVHGLDAAADGERHEALVGGALDHLDHRAAAVRGGGHVEKDHFVRARLVVAEREFHRVADVAQAALFGHAELDAARDLAVVDVKTGNDTFCNHADIEAAAAKQIK